MNARIPEDLSGLPGVDEPEAPEPPSDVTLPENLSDLPEAPEPAEEEQPEQAPVPPGGRLPRRTGTLLLAAVAALALLVVAREIGALVSSSYAVHPALGWAVAGLTGLILTLLGVIVAREVEGYLRLANFENMRQAFAQLDASPHDPELNEAASRELESYLEYLQESAEPELLARIRRLRERMDLAESPVEWREDVDRILLGPMDEEAREAVHREAVNVGIGTAISPYGLLDAVVATWRNVRLVRRIADIYRVRAGAYGTYLIIRRTITSAALADLAHEASVALLGTTRSLFTLVGAPVAQGLANAALTVRLGLGALEACRPMPLAEDQRRGIVETLMGSVVSAVRRVASRAKTDAPDAREEGLQSPDT
ncbi:MAG: DUF697 domain-containing protein [Candidatus Brocadiia bacterium]